MHLATSTTTEYQEKGKEAVILPDELDLQIQAAQKELAEILHITETYTGPWKEYEEIFNDKVKTLLELYGKFAKYLCSIGDTDGQKIYEEKQGSL